MKTSMKMIWMISLIFRFLLLFIISFSNTLEANEVQNEDSLEKVSLQLHWLDQFQFAGYYMAKEKGFFKDVGLDVKIKKFNNNIYTLKEVEEKRATYGIGRSALIVNKADGSNIKLLMSAFQSSPFILLTTENTNIKSIKDFIAKRIMITQDTSLAISLNAMAIQAGVRLKDMTTLKHSFDVQDLINNKTDLISAYISNEPFILKQLGVKYTIFDPKEHGFDFYSDILFTSSEETKQHKQRTINFTHASIKGWEYAFEHINETIDVILKKYNVQNKSREALIFEANELKKLAYFKTKNLGEINPNKIQRIYDIYNVIGLVHNKINLDDLIFKLTTPLLTLSREEQNYLTNKKVIRVCTIPDAMPYSKIQDDKFIGISADFLDLISQKLGVRHELVITSSWSESHQFIKNDNCDILPIVQKTPKRKSYLNFSSSYASNPLIIATTMDKIFISDIKNILDKKLGIAKGYSYAELLRLKYPNINLIEVENPDIGLHKVANGELYGFIGDLVSNAYNIQRNYLGLLKVSGYAGPDIKARIGVSKTNTALLSSINKAIESLTQKEKQNIINRWLSVNVEQTTDYTLIIQLILVFIIIFIIISLFIYKQKKHQKELEDSKEQLQKYLDLMSDGFAIVNASTRKFVFCNRAFEKLTGYKFHNLQDMQQQKIHPKDSLPFIEEQMRQQAQGIIITAKNIPILHKNGEISVCDVDSNVIEINEQTYFFGIFKSNSQNVQIHHKLRLENKRLKELISQYENN